MTSVGADAGERRHQQQRGRRRSEEDGPAQQQHADRAAGVLAEFGRGRRNELDRQQRAERELPGAKRREIEDKRRIAIAHRESRRKGERGSGRKQQPGALRREAIGKQHQQRHDQIELLLHAQRPRMQQRLCLGGRVEISGCRGKVDVRDRTDRACQALRIVLEFDGQAVEVGERAGDEEHHEQRRQDPQHPALVEIRQRERSLAEVAIDHAADQIARNHEEDIDPDEAARKAGNAGVVEQHGDDGERAQPIDVGAVFHRSGLKARRSH